MPRVCITDPNSTAYEFCMINDEDLYSMCLFCLPKDELLGETDSLLPPKLGAELLNFLTKVLTSLGQIPITT